MPIKAITFDAYGTLVRNEDLMLVPQRIIADHYLSAIMEGEAAESASPRAAPALERIQKRMRRILNPRESA